MARALSGSRVFVAAYLMLGVAAGAAIGAAIVLVQRPGPQPPPPWSSWRPISSSTDRQAREIANHVGGSYRLPSGNQLTGIQLKRFTVARPKAIGVMTKWDRRSAQFQLYDYSKSVFFVLCGTGANCEVSEGASSKAQGTVLRREALELALYTFEYVKPVDHVGVFLPRIRGEKTLKATMLFHRSDLSSSLSRPLRATLPQVQPPLPGQVSATERRTVNDLTGTKLYLYIGPVTAPGGGKMVALQPPRLTPPA